MQSIHQGNKGTSGVVLGGVMAMAQMETTLPITV